jgi:dTDP-4-dehydrorhamnose reductase
VTVLVVGNGLIGASLARALPDAVACSRRPPAGDGGGIAWRALDAVDAAECRRVVAEVRPEAVVLVHGPSDATWCQSHPDEALAAHATATANLVAAAPGARFVLVSTDNVFAGTECAYDENATTAPANAYGRAKLGAERELLDHARDATVLRVSLVYGWQPVDTSGWFNFFAAVVGQLGRGERVAAPPDHWNTPVLADDVVRVVAAILPGGVPNLLHLGGPDRISRYDWARRIAARLGHPSTMVTAVPRELTRYASRPVNSCLSSRHLGHLDATRDIPVRGVDAGLAALLADRRTP